MPLASLPPTMGAHCTERARSLWRAALGVVRRECAACRLALAVIVRCVAMGLRGSGVRACARACVCECAVVVPQVCRMGWAAAHTTRPSYIRAQGRHAPDSVVLLMWLACSGTLVVVRSVCVEFLQLLRLARSVQSVGGQVLQLVYASPWLPPLSMVQPL